MDTEIFLMYFGKVIKINDLKGPEHYISDESCLCRWFVNFLKILL